MADSWGLIIVLFFIFAIVFFVIKQFIEYPGLLNLQCIYSDDNVTGETLFENFQMDKLRDSVHSQKSNSHKKPSSSLPSSLSYSYSSSSYSCGSSIYTSKSDSRSSSVSSRSSSKTRMKKQHKVKISDTKIIIHD